MSESSSAAAGSRDERTGDRLLGYHLHDETGSQTAARRQDDARSRAQRRRQRQVQRGVTPSQASPQASQHPQIPNAWPSQSDQIAPDGGSNLDGDGVESDIFEDDGVFEDMPDTSGRQSLSRIGLSSSSSTEGLIRTSLKPALSATNVGST